MDAYPGFENFKLSQEEYEILVTLQAAKAGFFADRRKDDAALKARMEAWTTDWVKLLFDGKRIKFTGPLTKSMIRNSLDGLDRLPVLKRHIIVFEAYIFEPFFTIGKRAHDGLAKDIRSASGLPESARADLLGLLATSDVERNLLEKIEDTFEEGIKKFRPSRLFERVAIGAVAAVLLGVTAGFGAPAIGAALGGFWGLSGAAATSAGLAFLGGGALAAGGLGMLGGTIAIVGGGAILGGALGSAGFALASSPKLIVRELGKLYVIAIKFVPLVDAKQKSEVFDEMTLGLRKFRDDLRAEIARMEASKDERERENLSNYKESLESLESFRTWFNTV